MEGKQSLKPVYQLHMNAFILTLEDQHWTAECIGRSSERYRPLALKLFYKSAGCEVSAHVTLAFTNLCHSIKDYRAL